MGLTKKKSNKLCTWWDTVFLILKKLCVYIYKYLPQFDTFDTLEMIRVSIFPCSSLCFGCFQLEKEM